MVAGGCQMKVTCDKTRCDCRNTMIWCWEYAKYPYQKCPLYGSPVSDPPIRTKSQLENEVDGKQN